MGLPRYNRRANSLAQSYFNSPGSQAQRWAFEFRLRFGPFLFTLKWMNDLGLLSPGLLHARGEEQKVFHETAAQAAQTHFGRQVFVRDRKSTRLNFSHSQISY